MENDPIPTSSRYVHETSDTPIYDQLRQEYTDLSTEVGSIGVPSTEAVSPSTQEIANNEDVRDAIDALDTGLATVNNGDNTERPTGLELTPEEEAISLRFESLSNLRSRINEQHIIPSLNKIGRKLDRGRDAKDSLEKKVFLLHYREGARQRKEARLETKLAKMNPNSMRYRRLDRKIGKNHRKLRTVQQNINRLNSQIDGRENTRERINNARNVEAKVRREMLIVAKKVAHEKRERRKIKNELKSTTNTAQREVLKAEFAMRSKKTIGKFREELVEKVLKNAENERRSSQL